jgi:Trm5-related predicted tRNA methylase
MEALLHKDRRRANLKNRMDESIEQAILAFAVENPAAGQVRVSNELRKRAIMVSPTRYPLGVAEDGPADL